MIGVFDSGIGGLSVLKELIKVMPNQEYVYFSDNAFAPYGTKDLSFIQDRCRKITEFLLSKGAEMIVVACNTATAAAISLLREEYDIPFIGIEPAVKPAAYNSKTGVVGVMATENTLNASKYQETLEKFASNVKVVQRAGVGLVESVERGELEGFKVERLIHNVVDDMLAAGADCIVLGCTHYPFLTEAIAKVVGNDITIINPAPAVAAQAQKVLAQSQKMLAQDVQILHEGQPIREVQSLPLSTSSQQSQSLQDSHYYSIAGVVIYSSGQLSDVVQQLLQSFLNAPIPNSAKS